MTRPMISSQSEPQILSRIYLKTAADQPLAQQILDWFSELNSPPISDAKIWWQCQTAFKEAFDNLVEHAHAGLPLDTPIEVEAIRLQDCIEMRLWDYGPEVDLQAKLQTMPDLLENGRDRGRGLHLINRIADEWSYTRTEDGRNCMFILKLFSPKV